MALVNIRPRASVLVTNHHKFVLIFRHKNNQDYYAVPGGGVEPGETPQDAAIREIMEELGLSIKNLKLISEIKDDGCHDFNFTAETDDSQIKVTGPEKNHLADPDNLFKPQWLDKSTIDHNLPVYPISSRNMFYNMLENL